jgi:FAD/FMN-containing dehydrogenase
MKQIRRAFHAYSQPVKSAVSSLDPDTINIFRKSIGGSVLIPGETGYEVARRAVAFNPDTNKFPSLVVKCINNGDVLRCLDLAHKFSLEVAIRSGNHSFLGWGTSEKGIVVDLSGMKNVDVDPVRQTALAMTGATAAEILNATSSYGLAPVLGQSGVVGSGLLLGGGLGWLSGKHGAICDNVLSAEIITAEGKTLVADNINNADLFWAIRGGGGNFGIVTRIEYMLHPLSEVLAGRFIYPVSAARDMFRFFRQFMAEAPDELQADCYLVSADGGMFMLEFVYSGDLVKGEELMNVVRRQRKPDKDEVTRKPFSEIYSMYVDTVEAAPTFLSIKGIYIDQLSDEVFDAVFDQFQQAPSQSDTFFDFAHYMHGAVCRVPPESTAFELRKSGGSHLATSTAWSDESQTAACMEWHAKMFDALLPFSGGRIYGNYMSTSHASDAAAVYGGNYERLVKLKRKYDPTNFFRLNQNIRAT